jgi:hypothetical protein
MAHLLTGIQHYNQTLRLGNDRPSGASNPNRVQKLLAMIGV